MLNSTFTFRGAPIAVLLCMTTAAANAAISPGDLVIREFRLRGPVSATDEYIVLHNRTAADITVASGDMTAGFAVASSSGTVAFIIPNGTVIKAHGHYLGVNTSGFSLGATPDATWTSDIGDGEGLAIFDSANSAAFGVSAMTIDAVGVGSSSAPYLEGAALTSLTTPGEYAWVRKAPNGVVTDTGSSGTDFLLVSTNGATYNAVQSILGPPAPANSSNQDVLGGLGVSLIEPSAGVNLNPNRVRYPTPIDHLEFRRRITNNTGGPLTALRLRFVEVSTFNSPGYSPGATQADLRPNTSVTRPITLTSIGATSVNGLSLVTPPTQAMGGGWNSILTVPGGPLADGASVDLNIELRVSRVGAYRFFATVETKPGNSAPSVTTSGGTTAFTENAGPVAVDGSLTVTDDGGTLDSATATISNLLDAGSEILFAAPSGAILAGDIVYAAPTLTITRVGASVADYQAVLRSVKYNNTSDTPATTTRVVDFVANDGFLSSSAASQSVSVTPANDPPVLTAGATLAYTENDPATVIDGTATVTDPDSTDITQATVRISTNYQNGQDILSFATIGPISGAFVAGAGTLTLSGTDTLANYQAALRTVKYNNTSENPSTLARSVEWRATDGTDLSVVGVTSTINVTAVNDAPVVTAGGTLNYTENQAATAIDSGLTVSDVDSTNLTGATVQITANYANGDDVLSYVTALGISGVFNAPTGTLTLTGTTTVANYQTALRNVRYNNTSENPTTAARTISWQVNDGAGVSNLSSIVTSTINVTAVNDAPIGLTKAASAQANMKIVGVAPGLLSGASDPDNGINGCATTLSLASINTGTNGTVSNVNLGAGTFDFEPAAGFTGTATATYTVSDNGCPGPGATSSPATINITVNGPVIWFVDDSAAGGGDGRLGREFQTVGAATTAIGANTNQKIFVYSGTYTQGATLNTNGWLIGQGTTGSFDTVFGITPPSGTIARPTLGGARPQLGSTVTMGTNSNVTGLNIVSAAATGITATGKTGLVTSEVSVTTTTGIAASFSTSGGVLSFTSISSNGAANGIILTSTSGSFGVTGTGSTDGSGGVIQNITNRGFAATSASNISLKNMTFTNANTADASPCGAADNSGCNGAVYLNSVATVILDNVDINGTAQQGINLREVNGFQLLNSTTINTGAGGQTEEAGLYAINLFGTCAITNSSLTVPAERAAVIYNTSKTMALTVTGSTFGMNQAQPLGADGLEVDSYGASNTTIDIVNSTFVQPKTNGLQAISENTSVTSVDVTGSTFDPGTGLAAAIDLVTNNTASMKFNIIGNPSIKGKGINVINVYAFPDSTFEGRINNNTVASNGGSGSGIRVFNTGNGNSKVEIKSNVVTGIGDYGIDVTSQSGNGRLDATVTGNNVTVTSTGFYAIHALAGASGSPFTNKVCANVANNTTTVTPGAIGDFQARAATASHQMLLEGGGSTVATNWTANTNSTTTPPAVLSQSGVGTFTFGASCLVPTNPLP